MSDIPEDVLQASLLVWIDALRDGTPDAAKIIARAIMASWEDGYNEALRRVHDFKERYPGQQVIIAPANVAREASSKAQ